MRKIYQSAPDVPQGIANKATSIIERHLSAGGVRRVEDMSEESRVHLYRELKFFFESNLPPLIEGKDGEMVYARTPKEKEGIVKSAIRRLVDLFSFREYL